ncbi:MAG: hypothetical protein ACWA6X_07555, partial [Bauldia sp.]
VGRRWHPTVGERRLPVGLSFQVGAVARGTLRQVERMSLPKIRSGGSGANEQSRGDSGHEDNATDHNQR